MKGISHGKRLKPCSRDSGAGERSLASKPVEANCRAAARANPHLKPRNANLRTASVSDCMKPASSPQATARWRWVLRGREGQRGRKEVLGTWDTPHGAGGVSRTQRASQRNHKLAGRRGEVGEAHSSDEAGESWWSEGALATGMRTQKHLDLIGGNTCTQEKNPMEESEAGLRGQTTGSCECRAEETPATRVGQQQCCQRKPDAGNPHVRFDEGEGAGSLGRPLSTLPVQRSGRIPRSHSLRFPISSAWMDRPAIERSPRMKPTLLLLVLKSSLSPWSGRWSRCCGRRAGTRRCSRSGRRP
jgi:hypothetical protein